MEIYCSYEYFQGFNISAKGIGILYVIYGKSFLNESLNVQSGISSRDGFRIIGSSSDYANLGIALSKGMDFNGDGQLDILFTTRQQITINGEEILHILFGVGNSFSSDDIYLNNSLSSLVLTKPVSTESRHLCRKPTTFCR